MLAPDALASLSLCARLFSIRLQRRIENCPEQCHAPLPRYSSCILNRSGYFSSRKTQTFLIDPFSDDGIQQYLEWFECKQGSLHLLSETYCNTAPCARSDWSSGSTDIILQTNARRSHQRSVLNDAPTHPKLKPPPPPP